MGADGGVVYIPLKHPSIDRYDRVRKLLEPFWQFLSQDGGADWADEANYKWMQENSIGAPKYILGYYGTDRCDNFDLGDLASLCEPFEDWRGKLFELTFDELDLDCRTSPVPITSSYSEHPLRRLWHEHFWFYSREETLEKLGSLAHTRIDAWAREIESLLNLQCTVHEETWT